MHDMFHTINKETIMQKRYCACGQPVWVEYKCTRQMWTVLLHAGGQGFGRARREERCTGCGQPLHIDRLH